MREEERPDATVAYVVLGLETRISYLQDRHWVTHWVTSLTFLLLKFLNNVSCLLTLLRGFDQMQDNKTESPLHLISDIQIYTLEKKNQYFKTLFVC